MSFESGFKRQQWFNVFPLFFLFHFQTGFSVGLKLISVPFSEKERVARPVGRKEGSKSK